jgi:hypothetical protein
MLRPNQFSPEFSMSQVPPPNPYEASGYNPFQQTVWDPNDPAIREFAAAQVAAPAIALMVMAVVCGALGLCGLVFQLISLASSVAGAGNNPGVGPTETVVFGVIAVVSGGVGIFASAAIFYGGLKMRALENYTLSMVASILAIIPCVSPCCFVGIPIGIWAVVVLNRPEVRRAFAS